MRALSRVGIRRWLRAPALALAGFLAVPVSIAAGQTISLSSSSAAFASTATVPQAPGQNIVITNTGSSPLTGVQVSAVSYGAGQPTGWLTAFNNFGANTTIAPGAQNFVIMAVDAGTLPAGTYTASYTVSATNATNGPRTVNVTFTVAGPTLQLSSTSITFASTAAVPQAPGQNVVITNTGSSTMTGVQVSAVSYSAGQPTGWLTAFNNFGANTTITPGAQNSVIMSVDAGTLPAGTYTASYTVSATNSTNGPRTVNVTFTVAGPTLQLSSSSISFASTAAVPQAPGQNLVITNAGSSTLTGVQVSAVSYGAGQPTGWLTAFNNFGANTTITPGAQNSVIMSVDAGTLPAGTYTASYTVSATNSTNGPLTVNVTFTVFGPRLQLSSSTATFTAFAATPTPPAQSITVTNTGSSTLTNVQVSAVSYSAGQPTGWLTAFNNFGLNTTITPGAQNSVIMSVDATALPVGTYTATFQVTAANSNNGPLTVTVTLVMSAPPVIQFNPSNPAFTAVLNGANPASITVSVTGSGLTGLVVQSITYGAGQTTGWLAATLASATAPTTLTLQPTTGALAVGTYAATVTVASTNGAINTLPVTLTITPRPAIALGAVNVNVAAIQGQVTTSAVSVSNGGGGILNALGVGTITYAAGQPVGWLSATLASTTAPTQVNLSASAAGLNAGVYTATVPVNSAAPGVTNSPQAFTVTFTVSAPLAPTIALSSSSLGFTAQAGLASPPTQTVGVTNSGSGTLTGLSVGAIVFGAGQPTGWLAATLNTTVAPAILTVTPTLGALPVGTYTATIPISSSAANVTNSPVTIAVSFVVTAAPLPPVITLAPSSLGFSAPAGGASPASQTVAMGNGGAGTVQGLAVGSIAFGAGQPVGWLNASLNSTTSPATLTVNAVTGSLPVGTYTATIPITSSNAANSPATVSVTFTVTAVPTIGLSATTVAFTGSTGGAPPAQQNLAITNSGTGTLSGLTLDAVVYPAGQPIGWLAPSLSGTTAPATLTLQVNNTTFPPGNYSATLAVRSSVASNSPQIITVTYQLAATPAIALSTTSLNFTSVSGSANPPAQLVNVTNGGTGTLSGLAVSSITYGAGASGWLTATPSATTAPMSISVQPATGALSAGTYDATVTVTSPTATNSPQQFSVHFVVTPAAPQPGIVITPGTIMLSMQARSPSTRSTTVQITNAIAGVLTGLVVGAPIYASDAGWLSATLGQTSTPATLTLRGSTRTLVPGLYQATVPVSATGAVTTSLTIRLEVVDLKACERALTDATQLSAAERARLDQLGNNDGSYNLGDYLALRARLGLP